MEEKTQISKEKMNAFANLESGVHAALETYSNVHRGSGHYSMVTTHLYEQAREIVLDYLGLSKSKYKVIFCTPARATALVSKLKPESYRSVASHDVGLSLGVKALAVNKKALPKGVPLESGGGTTKLISREWVIWANAPDKFEAGTPAIINVIAFARALRMVQQYGKDVFLKTTPERLTAAQILSHDDLEKYSGRELLNELRKTLIGRGINVPTMEGLVPFINLDNSASTPTFDPIWDAFRKTLPQADEVKQEIVAEVKFICADMLHAPISNYEIIFTSNATEAINLAARNISLEKEDGIEPVILSTDLEHSSNDLPWRMLPGFSQIRISADDEGFVDLKEMETLLSNYNKEAKFGKKRIKLIAISAASNVLGTYNNIMEISRIAHHFGAKLMVDAAQLIAHCKLDIESCKIDYLAFSAHKVYAPFGCGVLIVRKELLNFNSEELKRIKISGEENAGGIAALGKAFALLKRIGMNLIEKEEQLLLESVLRDMAQIESLKIYGINNPDSANFTQRAGVIAFSLKSMITFGVAKELAFRNGIGVRYGCHCAHILVKHILHVTSGLEKFQKVLQMLIPAVRFPGVVRVSLGIENSKKDVDTLINALENISKKSYPSTNNKGTPILTKGEVKQQIKDYINTASKKVYSEI
ncbi:MAG: aminotransferase class V-fold PLP-dependent enzyme [Bacteroidota bacterium]